MQVVITEAPVTDRKALLDILFIKEVKCTLDMLPTDTSESLLERIGERLFWQIDVDGMLYGFAAIIDGDSIIVGRLPEFTDTLPLIRVFNTLIQYSLTKLKRPAVLFYRRQEALFLHTLPYYKRYGKIYFFHNPLLSPVVDKTIRPYPPMGLRSSLPSPTDKYGVEL